MDYVARIPDVGDVIPETGWVRKTRRGCKGSGKRGGSRIVYFYHAGRMPLFLILVYTKGRQADMTPDLKKQVRAVAAWVRFLPVS